MSGPKSPFERIISLVDRKKLFNKLINDQLPIVCKLHNGRLVSLQGFNLTREGHLEVMVGKKELSGSRQRQGVVFFYVGRDRYFVYSKLVRTATGWRVMSTTDFYKLNRRESFRVEVPANTDIRLHVTSVEDTRCNVQARVTEFSSGGARIRWFGNPQLKKGYGIKGTLLWMRGKEVPLYAAVRHQTRTGLYGIVFTNLDSIQAARLRFLSIELQQLVNYLAK